MTPSQRTAMARVLEADPKMQAASGSSITFSYTGVVPEDTLGGYVGGSGGASDVGRP